MFRKILATTAIALVSLLWSSLAFGQLEQVVIRVDGLV